MSTVLVSFSLEGHDLGKEFVTGLASLGFDVVTHIRKSRADEFDVQDLKSKLSRADACVVVAMPRELKADAWIGLELGLGSGAGRKPYLVGPDVEQNAPGILAGLSELVPASVSALAAKLQGSLQPLAVAQSEKLYATG